MPPRKLTLKYRQPGSETIEDLPIDVHADGKDATLLVVRGGSGGILAKVAEACAKAGLYNGGYLVRLPAGAEFEVWEET